MLVDRKRYDKNDLLKSVIQFKADHKGTLPTKEEWKNGEMKPSLRTFQRRLGNIKDMLAEADKYDSVGEFENKLVEDEQKRELKEYKRKYNKKSKKPEIEEQSQEEERTSKPRSRKSTAKTPYGLQCSFCGNYTTDSNEYYSSLTKILLTRFINLLNSNSKHSYFEGVMDCIHAVWGGHNSVMTRALEVAGYLDTFEQRHGKSEEGLEHKFKCEHCDKWKYEWQITIDNSKVARQICENCLSNHKKQNE